MSTPAFKRLRYSLIALGSVVAVALAVIAALQVVAARVEKSGVVYPYKQEDWLRYLLPSLWRGDQRPLLLLAGPSTVRENLLFEEFAAAFPNYRVLNGGLSSGTLGDMMAGLEYVERAYGADALPRVVVLGLSPRFMAEIPRAGRPFGMGLARYSPYFKVPGGDPDGFGLVRKGPLEGAVAHARFLLLKQHERYVAAADWQLAQLVSPQLSERIRSTPFMAGPLGRMLFSSGRVRDIGIHRFALELASPYKYRSGGNPFGDIDVLLDSSAVWRAVWDWDPDRDAPAIRARVAALEQYAQQHGIELFVVNLPEGSRNRIRYRPGYDERYHKLIESAFQPLPVLDLRCLLPDESFLDAEHARLRGARLVTQKSIGFVQDIALVRASTAHGVVVADVLRKWQAIDCPESRVKDHEQHSPADRNRSARASVAGAASTGP